MVNTVFNESRPNALYCGISWPMIFGYQSYRQYLKVTLADRIGRNPAYSLRAMARDIDISPGLLSLILSQKKNLSDEKALDVAACLELDERETEYFSLLVQLEKTTRETHRNRLLEKI